jgi:hypothetical protein
LNENRGAMPPGNKRNILKRGNKDKDEVLADVKKEVERLIDANFIQPCRYAESISNIVLVYKKMER